MKARNTSWATKILEIFSAVKISDACEHWTQTIHLSLEGADGGLVPAERRGEVAAEVEKGGGGEGGLGGGGVAAEEEGAEHDGDHEGGEDDAQGDRALLALGQSGSVM